MKITKLVDYTNDGCDKGFMSHVTGSQKDRLKAGTHSMTFVDSQSFQCSGVVMDDGKPVNYYFEGNVGGELNFGGNTIKIKGVSFPFVSIYAAGFPAKSINILDILLDHLFGE